jgi:hypothetical protein
MKFEKYLLIPERVRKIDGSFSFIPHQFLTGGFFSSLTNQELLVYFLLVLVGDRDGLSFYSQERVCVLLKMSIDDFIRARNGLIQKSLIAFDGFMFQVLSLPEKPVRTSVKPLTSPEDFLENDALTIRRFLQKQFSDSPKKEDAHGH